MEDKKDNNQLRSIEYQLLGPISSVELFLKDQFQASGNKLKKYFSKSFLNRKLNAKDKLILPLNFINDGQISPCYEGQALKVLFEDEDFFVFEKNANQHTHPLTYDEGDNCLSWMRLNRPELLNVNQDHYDRGLLYRLDFETSGLMIYVKKNEHYKMLRESFNELVKEKTYQCWVEGHVDKERHLIHSFRSSELKGKRVLVDAPGVHEMKGELSFKVLNYNSQLEATLLEVSLKTGLRHQIRAQLAHEGFPLVGDQFYGAKKAKRLYLHACRYGFIFRERYYFFESSPSNFDGL